MRLPRDSEELLPTLAVFGMAIGLAKLLASKAALTWRAVIGRAVQSAALAMCAGVVLVLPQVSEMFEGLKTVPPVALLGVGGLLASLGVSGLIGLVRALRGVRE